jgi:hypothetical protein
MYEAAISFWSEILHCCEFFKNFGIQIQWFLEEKNITPKKIKLPDNYT